MKTTELKSLHVPSSGYLEENISVLSFGGLFISMLGTSWIWAGCDTFHCDKKIWLISLASNLVVLLANWTVYAFFKRSNKVIISGIIAIFGLINLFWLFGIAGFYFFLIFGPILLFVKAGFTVVATATLLYRSYLIASDIQNAVKKRKNLLLKMYDEQDNAIIFCRNSVALLEKARPKRNPFKAIHIYVALAVAPLILVLNRTTAPIIGEGTGPFFILAFLGYPIMLWLIEVAVQTIATMIYYPIKLEKTLGKPVLLGVW